MGREAIARSRGGAFARRRRALRASLGRERYAALRDAALAFVVSRAIVWVTAVWSAALLHSDSASVFDHPDLTHPFGAPLDSLFAPLARWDSVWFLGIAHSGYSTGGESAFFPLYPMLVRGLAPTGDRAALLVSAYVVSLATFAGALYLVRRLAELELGDAVRARRATMLLAFFPGALWFGVPYSESVFLLLSVGAFYAARRERWAWAGVCAGLVSATRVAGIVLLLPLAIIWWRSRPRRVRDAAWLALAPVGVALYSLYLALDRGDGFAYMHIQRLWFRSFAGPFGAIPDGVSAAWDGARQLLSGAREPVYNELAGGSPFIAAAHNLELFGFLVFALVAVVGIVRRLAPEYAVYTVAALALPLSTPVAPQPLMSLPRFLAVLFPIFLWLGQRRGYRVTLAAFGVLLVVFTVRYASWHWVA
jgi:hypothetical protein